MACCCNNSYSGLPCCCPPYTTTTTTIPICEGGTICPELYTTDCVVYNGPRVELSCITIEPGSKYTDVLESLISILLPCVGPTTTTTICTRPQGLDEFVIFNQISSDGGVTFTDFTGSEGAACQALGDYLFDSSIYELDGSSIDAAAIEIGEAVYNSSTDEDCTTIADGYYVFLSLENYVIRIQGGFITEKITCPTGTTTTTTSTTTSTTTTTTIPCSKPAVINDYFIFNEISSDGGVIFTDFTATETSACTALSDFENLAYIISSIAVEAVSLNIGENVYNPGEEDCTFIPDGYYIVIDVTNFVMRVQSGVITEITDCTTTTTTTSTTTTTTVGP